MPATQYQTRIEGYQAFGGLTNACSQYTLVGGLAQQQLGGCSIQINNAAVGNFYGVTTASSSSIVYNNIYVATTHETEEEKTARLALEAVADKKRVEAKQRAEMLLLSILNPEQAAQYTANGWFETEVNDSVYRIHRARSMNVERMVDGKATHKYCAHPGEMTPDEDVMLAQLLMLQTNEAKFLSTANVRVLEPQKPQKLSGAPIPVF